MRPGHFLAIAALAALPGCPSSSECEQDFDCTGGQVCANTHECLSSTDVRRVEIRWTLYGQQASDSTCGSIDHMELTVFNSAADQSATYSPVPCEPGQFVFLKLPTGYDNAALSAYVGGTFAEAEQGFFDGGGVVAFDFSQGSILVDAGVPDVDAAPPPFR